MARTVSPRWRTPDWRAGYEPPLRRVIRAAVHGAPPPPEVAPPAFRTRLDLEMPGRYAFHSENDAGDVAYLVDAPIGHAGAR
jgi:hypothetical protein